MVLSFFCTNGKLSMSHVSGMAHNNMQHPEKEVTLQLSHEEINIGSYIAHTYESDWYVGTIKDISTEHNDVLVTVEHRNTMHVSFSISDNQLNSNSNHVLIILFNHSHVTRQYI